jgi:hypothetical protein
MLPRAFAGSTTKKAFSGVLLQHFLTNARYSLNSPLAARPRYPMMAGLETNDAL